VGRPTRQRDPSGGRISIKLTQKIHAIRYVNIVEKANNYIYILNKVKDKLMKHFKMLPYKLSRK